MVRTYKPKALIDGWKLGAEYGGKKFVAIPKQHFNNNSHVVITYDNRNVIIRNTDSPKLERTFKDKFGRGEYTLCYFEWFDKTDQGGSSQQ